MIDMKKTTKGFTLAEMLIVVAIIGVLVTIMTVTISNSLERSREAVDVANVRNAMSEVYNAALNEDKSYLKSSSNNGVTSYYYQKVVHITQKQWGWQMEDGAKAIIINGATVQAKQGNDNDKKLNTGWYVRYYISGPNEGKFYAHTKTN